MQTFNACAISSNDCVPQRVDSDAEWPVSRLTVLSLDGVLFGPQAFIHMGGTCSANLRILEAAAP